MIYQRSADLEETFGDSHRSCLWSIILHRTTRGKRHRSFRKKDLRRDINQEGYGISRWRVSPTSRCLWMAFTLEDCLQKQRRKYDRRPLCRWTWKVPLIICQSTQSYVELLFLLRSLWSRVEWIMTMQSIWSVRSVAVQSMRNNLSGWNRTNLRKSAASCKAYFQSLSRESELLNRATWMTCSSCILFRDRHCHKCCPRFPILHLDCIEIYYCTQVWNGMGT